MLSIGIYKKQLIFFLILLPVLIYGGYLVSKQFSSASVLDVSTIASDTNNYTIDVQINKDSTVLVNGKETKGLLHIGDGQDVFRYIAADSEGTYIRSITVNVTLPAGAKENEIKPVIYAVHGVGDSQFKQTNAQKIVYQATDLGPDSTFTVVANLPEGLIVFPFWQRFTYTLANMNAFWWLIVSLVPFLLTLFYLLLMTHRALGNWRLPKITNQIKKPPSDLSPAEVAILYESKVTNRAISGMLVDLAQRNYLNIICKNGDYSFGKKNNVSVDNFQNSANLKNYEKVLLSKIFTPSELSSDQEDILFRVSHHVFSRKIAQVYVDIYQEVTGKGFFSRDPVKMYQKYRQFGLILFFLGFIGLFFGIILAIEPKFFLIFWLMMMLTAMLVIKLAPNLPVRSDKGRTELLNWLNFKNFLASSEKIDNAPISSKMFEEYLPYAIALGCEVEWAKKFIGRPFEVPNWYIATQQIAMVEDFVNSLFPIIGQVSKTLVLSREPII